MGFEDVLKNVAGVAGLGISLYTLWQLAHNDSLGKWGRMREEYKFSKEFLVELRNSPEMSDFQKAKGYQAIAGSKAIGVRDGDYLMSLEEPARAMGLYVFGFDYVEHDSSRETEQIQFLKKYQRNWVRRSWKIFYTTVYVMCVFFAVAPLLLARYFDSQLSVLTVFVLTCLVVFVPGAWMSLQSLGKIIAAERLVSSQVSEVLVSPESSPSRSI